MLVYVPHCSRARVCGRWEHLGVELLGCRPCSSLISLPPVIYSPLSLLFDDLSVSGCTWFLSSSMARWLFCVVVFIFFQIYLHCYNSNNYDTYSIWGREFIFQNERISQFAALFTILLLKSLPSQSLWAFLNHHREPPRCPGPSSVWTCECD